MLGGGLHFSGVVSEGLLDTLALEQWLESLNKWWGCAGKRGTGQGSSLCKEYTLHVYSCAQTVLFYLL